MIERLKSNFENPKKGDLVELKPDLRESVISALASRVQMNTKYRLLYIQRHVEGGSQSAFIGPANMSHKDITEFDPEKADEGRYREVPPGIALTHLRKVRQ